MKNYSQASQDIFSLSLLKYKHNGTFVEIGSNDPIFHNNSYLMEKDYNWSGLLVEYEIGWASRYESDRPKSYYIINDARNVDYREFLDAKAFPNSIDYLQIDLDVDNRSTLDVLEKFEATVFDRYKFATVTFEHDIYTGNWFDTRAKSRDIFKKAGYILVFPDVQTEVSEELFNSVRSTIFAKVSQLSDSQKKEVYSPYLNEIERNFFPFEDWYAHPDLVDMSLIEKVRRSQSKTHLEIRGLLNIL